MTDVKSREQHPGDKEEDMKTLVVLAHPSIGERSLANRIIIERIRPIEGVTIKDLYKECPSFTFDIAQS